MRRRTFLKSAAFAAAAAPALHSAGSGMFLALNNSLNGGQPGTAYGPSRVMDYADFLRQAAATGFDGADVTLGNSMKLGAERVNALLAELKLRPGLASQIPALFPKDEAVFRANLGKLADAAAFTSAIGGRCMYAVIMPSSDTPKAELRKIYKDRLLEVSELLRKPGLMLGLKFVGLVSIRKRQPHEFIWRMDETLEFAKECGSNIGVMLDSWHWYHAGATPADIVAAGKSRIVSVHVSDAGKQPAEEVRDDQRLLPGEGVMDLVGFFGALRQIGYEGAISPEPIGRIPRDQWDGAGARLALEATKNVMRKAGIV